MGAGLEASRPAAINCDRLRQNGVRYFITHNTAYRLGDGPAASFDGPRLRLDEVGTSPFRIDKTARTVDEGIRAGIGRGGTSPCECGVAPEPGFVERIGAFVGQVWGSRPFSDRTPGFVDPPRHLCAMSASV